jgi:hypothetical protein
MFMPYQVTLVEPKGERPEKAIGENIFLGDLGSAYKVYVFYYPGAMPNEGLEEGLRRLGVDTGENLFVNIGRLDDPKFDKIAKKFGIEGLPVIIVTGVEGIASLKDANDLSTAYVKLDNPSLLKNIGSIVECVQRLFILFIRGAISEALEEGGKNNAVLKHKIVEGLRSLGTYLKDKDIEVSLLEGKFSITHKT